MWVALDPLIALIGYGSLNDVTVFQFSSLIPQLIERDEIEFVLNNNAYKHFYLLCDGIYPRYSVFQGPIENPVNEKEKLFNQKQSSIRKNVECTFGILKKKFEIIKKPCIKYDINFMNKILCCITILHNMAIKYNDLEEETEFNDEDDAENDGTSEKIMNKDTTNQQSVEAGFDRAHLDSPWC